MKIVCTAVFTALLAIGCVSTVRDGKKAAPRGAPESGKATGLGALREFATAYEPKGREDLPCPNLPEPPPGVRRTLESHPLTDEFCRHVSLVLLKLYRFHVENFSQGYDLRLPDSSNPFFVAFKRMVRIDDEWDEDKYDYLGSGMVLKWVILRASMLRDQRISREMDRIHATHREALTGAATASEQK